MTGSFVPQVLSIKADKMANTLTAGLHCGWFGTSNGIFIQ